VSIFLDKVPFLKGNLEGDAEEVVMVPTYAEVVDKVREQLKWNDPSYLVELEGRRNVGFGMHFRWKTMPLNSEQCWVAYKEVVAKSQDKALELFATKKIDSRYEFHLNRCVSPLHGNSPKPNDPLVDPDGHPPSATQDELSQPPKM
jgi:hypothetical protein